MIFKRLLLIFLAYYLIGCAGSKYSGSDYEDTIASYHMIIADSLVAKSSLRKATSEYLLVIKQYVNTKYFSEAVRKSADILCDPKNPVADDSTAMYWYRLYLTLPVTEKEKEHASVCIILLDRIKSLRDELNKLREVDVKMNEKEIK